MGILTIEADNGFGSSFKFRTVRNQIYIQIKQPKLLLYDINDPNIGTDDFQDIRWRNKNECAKIESAIQVEQNSDV